MSHFTFFYNNIGCLENTDQEIADLRPRKLRRGKPAQTPKIHSSKIQTRKIQTYA
jgi:hypothetical protein